MRHSKFFLWLLLLAAATIVPIETLSAKNRSVPTINQEKAKEAAREQVWWKDRVCTLSTLANDFLESIYGKHTYKGLSALQVVYGWVLRPDAWKEEPMIYIPDSDLRKQLGIEGEYAKFAELFDDTLGYRLNTLGSDLPERIRPMVRESKAAVELDEKVGMIILLTKGELVKARPDSIPPLPNWRVEGEILYNDTPLWVMILIPLLLFISVYSIWLHKNKHGKMEK